MKKCIHFNELESLDVDIDDVAVGQKFEFRVDAESIQFFRHKVQTV